MHTIRPIQSKAELEEVYRLTHDAYVEEGYCRPRPDGRLIHYPDLDQARETTILVALEEGRIVGTNSLTLDGPSGLHVDKDYGPECQAIRQTGRALASSWRIATHRSCRDQRKIVMSLITETVVRAVDFGVESCLFTFNPRHERIYKRLLNMRTIAHSSGTQGLLNAPSVFMRCDLETLPERWLPAALVEKKRAALARAEGELAVGV